MAVVPRAGQAGVLWTAATWAPLSQLSALQLAQFNNLISLHRYSTSRWIQGEFYARHQKFFQDVIYKVKNTDITYAYCVGLGSLQGLDSPRKQGETDAQFQSRVTALMEERIMQFVVFQTWLDLLNATPHWTTAITPNNIFIQEQDYTSNDMLVEQLFYQSLGYNTVTFPDLEDRVRLTGPRSFMFAGNNASLEGIAGMHGNAFAFQNNAATDGHSTGGLRFFVQGSVVNAHGRWSAKQQNAAQTHEDGTWIYKTIAKEYVGRSVQSICRPSPWIYLPQNLRFLSKMFCYWRLDRDADFQLINLDTYSGREDDNYSASREGDVTGTNVDDGLHWNRNDNMDESTYIIGTPRAQTNRIRVDGEIPA